MMQGFSKKHMATVDDLSRQWPTPEQEIPIQDLIRQLQRLEENKQQLNCEVGYLRESQRETAGALNQLRMELQQLSSAKQLLDAEWSVLNQYVEKAIEMLNTATQLNPFDIIRIFQEVKDNFWQAYCEISAVQQGSEGSMVYRQSTEL